MTRERLETWTVWILAVLLPGGLALLGVWLAARAAKRRSMGAGIVVAEPVSQVPQPLRG